jgi:hypothetical protein
MNLTCHVELAAAASRGLKLIRNNESITDDWWRWLLPRRPDCNIGYQLQLAL